MKQQNQKLTHVKHEFDPIFDENSEILILGTLPSVKSREQNFYYGHPQNRFWKVICFRTIGKDCPDRRMVKDHRQLRRNNIFDGTVGRTCNIALCDHIPQRNIMF